MTKKLPTYNDDEVKIFHPLFEYSFKPIILNNKKYFLEYELIHHRKLKNGLIPDYIFQNKKSKQSVLICELKRTKSSVFNFNFNEQVKGYAETLSEEMEKPFYLLTNLEVINLFKYSKERNRVYHQLIKPSPIKVGDFTKDNFKNFTNSLESNLKKIINLIFDDKDYEWKYGLSDLERLLEKNYNNKKNWSKIISDSLVGYIIGALIQKKIIDINKINISNINDDKKLRFLKDKGFKNIIQNFYKNDFDKKLFISGIEAGTNFEDGVDFGFVIQNLLYDQYSDDKYGTITSTDDELSNLVCFFSKFSLNKELNKNDLILDPSAGIGNLLVNLNKYHKSLNGNQCWANDIDFHFVECLELRLNLTNIKSDNYFPSLITNKDIKDFKKNDFNNVKIILCNPPFKRGANVDNSKEKVSFANNIKEISKTFSKLNIGQLGVECLHLEFLINLAKDKTLSIFIFPTRYLVSLSKEVQILRNFLICEFGLKYIVKYPHKNIFSNVAKNTCLLIGEKNTLQSNVTFIEFIKDMESINYNELTDIINNNKNNPEININLIPIEILKEKNNKGWSTFFSEKNFKNLITKHINFFVPIDKKVIFLPRGNAGNVGGSKYIFPNKNSLFGKNIFKLPCKYFTLGIKNSEKVPIIINKKSFNYLAFVPTVNDFKNNKDNIASLLINDLSQVNLKKKVVQYKKTYNAEEIFKKIINCRIYKKDTILIPRATRRHGKISILDEDGVISTNFVLINSIKEEDKYLLIAWFLSIFGQLQLEELSSNESGVRKTEINFLKNFLVPDFDKIASQDKDLIKNIILNEAPEPIDFYNIKINKIDNIWFKLIFKSESNKILLDFYDLLNFYIDVREP